MVPHRKIYEQWWVTQQGFSVGPTKMWADHKLWQEDPIMLPYRTAAESGRFAGYAGPVDPQGGGGHLEIHHQRHVREGGAGHGARRRGQMGACRARQDLHLNRSVLLHGLSGIAPMLLAQGSLPRLPQRPRLRRVSR